MPHRRCVGKLEGKLFRNYFGEICALIKAGFEYVTEMDGLKFFKKRRPKT